MHVKNDERKCSYIDLIYLSLSYYLYFWLMDISNMLNNIINFETIISSIYLLISKFYFVKVLI